MALSTRAGEAVSASWPTFLSYEVTRISGYESHSREQPTGFINLFFAQNALARGDMRQRYSQYMTQCAQLDDEDMNYPGDVLGSWELRTEVAKFLAHHTNPSLPLDPRHIVASNGVGLLIYVLAKALFDEGDYVLLPTPTYHCAIQDFCSAGVRIAPIETSFQQEYELTVQKIRETYEDHKSQGKTIKGFFLMSPSNPFGQVYPKSLLQDILHFCVEEKIHLIADEIYLRSIFKDDPPFTSCLALDFKEGSEDYFHYLYGLSKDFCSPGIRSGFLYTRNERLLEYFVGQNYYYHMSSVTENLHLKLLQDVKWREKVFTPMSHAALRESREFFTSQLDRIGIPYVRSCQAGFFVWMDLSRFLKSDDFDGERELFNRLFDEGRGVALVPGRNTLSSVPGYFRAVIAIPRETAQIVIQRIQAILRI